MHPPGAARRIVGMRLFTLTPALILALVFSSGVVAGIPELIAQGDSFDAKLDNAHALESYLQAESLGAKDPDTYVRIARQYALLMNDTPSDDKQYELGTKALDYSKRAVAMNSQHAKSLLSVAICYGRLVRFANARTKVEYSRLIKENAEQALQLDPTDSYAYHVLGAWNYELAQMGALTRAVVKVVYGGIPPASNEEAVKLFRKAVELAPSAFLITPNWAARMLHWVARTKRASNCARRCRCPRARRTMPNPRSARRRRLLASDHALPW